MRFRLNLGIFIKETIVCQWLKHLRSSTPDVAEPRRTVWDAVADSRCQKRQLAPSAAVHECRKHGGLKELTVTGPLILDDPGDWRELNLSDVWVQGDFALRRQGFAEMCCCCNLLVSGNLFVDDVTAHYFEISGSKVFGDAVLTKLRVSVPTLNLCANQVERMLVVSEMELAACNLQLGRTKFGSLNLSGARFGSIVVETRAEADRVHLAAPTTPIVF